MSFILSKINHLFNQIRGKVYNDLEKNLDVYVEIQEIKNSNYSNYSKTNYTNYNNYSNKKNINLY